MADRALGNAALTDTQGQKTNPTTSTVLADTGAVPLAGLYDLSLLLGASAAAEFAVQVRNAANDTTVTTYVVYGAAGQTGQYLMRAVRLDLGQRVRVVMNATLTGTAAAVVNAELGQ